MNTILFFKLAKNYYFEILFALSVLFLFLYGVFNIIKGKKGTWSKTFFYLEPEKSNKLLRTEQTNSNPGRESKGERECRRVLENYFGKPFPKCRPNFMNNEVTNFNLELDCYCPEIKLGCEYNGRQHYEYTPYFHKNKEAFHNQKYRDYMKRNLCNNNNIQLIEVPYTVKTQDIENFIVKKLKSFGY